MTSTTIFNLQFFPIKFMQIISVSLVWLVTSTSGKVCVFLCSGDLFYAFEIEFSFLCKEVSIDLCHRVHIRLWRACLDQSSSKKVHLLSGFT